MIRRLLGAPCVKLETQKQHVTGSGSSVSTVPEELSVSDLREILQMVLGKYSGSLSKMAKSLSIKTMSG